MISLSVAARLSGACIDGTQMAGAKAAGWVIDGARVRGEVKWPDPMDDGDAIAAGAIRLSDHEDVVDPYQRRV